MILKNIISLIACFYFFGIQFLNAQSIYNKTVEDQINYYMKVGDIPGLSIVIVSGDSTQLIKGFGYADLEKKIKVSSETLFEIGSCSKAFTGLGIFMLEKKGLLKLDDPVSKYLPWFHVTYKKEKKEITIRQLIHHTSGIPWETISDIPQDNSSTAIANTIKQVIGVELKNSPGKEYEYSTINYDILGGIIEKVTGKTYENYMDEDVFKALGLKNTSVKISPSNLTVATGYKIGFYAPRKYDAPIYRGNGPAGYVISNAEDMSRWLKLQIGLVNSNFESLITETHIKDESVAPSRSELASYAVGWFVSLKGDGKIYHGGLNPNYTAYVAFSKTSNLGIVVLANSNSDYTEIIGNYLFETLKGEKYKLDHNPNAIVDNSFSVLAVILGLFLILVITYLSYLLFAVIKGIRKYSPIKKKEIGRIGLIVLFLIPVSYGIYLIPKAMIGFSWESIIVWSPISFAVFIGFLISTIGFCLLTYIIDTLFQHPNPYWKSAPSLVAISLLSGLSNMAVILIITGSIGKKDINYNLFYFILAFGLYIIGRKLVQTKLFKITMSIVFDLRVKLANKIFATSYQYFEKLDRGRIYTTLNNDTATIGNSANVAVNLITSIITVLGGFIFLATIAFWATIITLASVTIIVVIYNNVIGKAEKYFEIARDTQNVYMKMVNGIIDGFKELSLQNKKKSEYEKELISVSDTYRNNNVFANIKLINAFLVGESLLILILGLVVFGIPKLFPQIKNYESMSFVIVLLYLIGPVNGILNSIPVLIQLKVAWKRIHQFFNDIPANIVSKEGENWPDTHVSNVKNIVVENVNFEYKNEKTLNNFKVGPINFELNKGNVLFIIGGNGSGKTTLAKLITGLYKPDNGRILINDIEIDSGILGEYYSTVLNPFHLFDKMYNVDLKEKSNELNKYLKILDLDKKVEVSDNKFSTTDLSGGQRKRLALLQCYLEDRPIYLFDEWAADQDPEYKNFFYRNLLPKMKKDGKIIIAITHDDHYFDIADKILKLDMGTVEFISNSSTVENALYSKSKN
ncbi:MAG: cyclic peptide export ABC transporter [Bacteroidales bacterium]|nr:cyclic peptide export ABC transporter [Bacteroidales bacterium]